MPATATHYTKHLDGDINKIFFNEYGAYPSLYDKVAKVSTAPRGGHYKEAELSDLGNLATIPEGSPVSYDTPKEGHEKEITFPVFGLGFQITRQMVTDDLQRNFMKIPANLGRKAAYKRETEFWDLFNNGFATHQAWDATETSAYIFSTSHKTLKSAHTIKNRPATDAALSETSLQSAFEYFDGGNDNSNTYGAITEAGEPLNFKARWLVVPSALRWTAHKLRKSEGPYQSADRNINTVNPKYGVIEDWEPIVVVHLTSTTAWFVLASEHDLRFMWKWPVQMESADDFDTGNSLYKVTERFDCACFDYKGAYGTSGA